MSLEIYSHEDHEELSKPALIRALHGVARDIIELRVQANINIRAEHGELDLTQALYTNEEYLDPSMTDSQEWLNFVHSVVLEEGRNYDKALGGVHPEDLYFPSVILLDDLCAGAYIDANDWIADQPALGGIVVSLNGFKRQLQAVKNIDSYRKLIKRFHEEYFTSLMYINRGYGFDEDGFETIGSISYFSNENPRDEEHRDVRSKLNNKGGYSAKVIYALIDQEINQSEVVVDATIDLAKKWLHRMASYQFSEDMQNVLAYFYKDIEAVGLKSFKLTVMPPTSLVTSPEFAGTTCSKINPNYLVLNPIIFKSGYFRDEEKIGSNILDMLTVIDSSFLYAVRDIFFSNDLDISQALENRKVSSLVQAYYKEFDWIWNYPVPQARSKQLKKLQSEINHKLVADLQDHLQAV